MAEARDNSGVRFPPPLVYVAGLLAGWLLERKYPLTSLPRNFSIVAAIVLILAGMALARSGALAIWKANSSIIPIKPTTAVVSHGVFQFTRNPMYAGLVVIYAGIALLIRSAWAFILLPLVILAVDRLVIAKEERYLGGKFGEQYVSYKNKVRRWI
jgi:protein-S-isoprenylcysteine O-methyltransferase Ste14